MELETLMQALQDRTLSQETTCFARTAAVSARANTEAFLARLNEDVQLHVAKTVGATVELLSSNAPVVKGK